MDEREDPDADRTVLREMSRTYIGEESFGGPPGDHVVAIVLVHITAFDAATAA